MVVVGGDVCFSCNNYLNDAVTAKKSKPASFVLEPMRMLTFQCTWHRVASDRLPDIILLQKGMKTHLLCSSAPMHSSAAGLRHWGEQRDLSEASPTPEP